jgi:hypothetical protein
VSARTPTLSGIGFDISKAWQVAKRRRARLALQGGGPSAAETSVITMLSERDDFITEIESVRSRAGIPVELYNKARALLTRFWARADWSEREEILKAVRWIMNVAKIQSSMTSANGRSKKRRRSRSQLKVGAPLQGKTKRAEPIKRA